MQVKFKLLRVYGSTFDQSVVIDARYTYLEQCRSTLLSHGLSSIHRARTGQRPRADCGIDIGHTRSAALVVPRRGGVAKIRHLHTPSGCSLGLEIET
eukprot:1040476-Amphidinium_carterae.1